MQEVTALNRFSQQVMAQASEKDADYRELAEGLKKLVLETAALAESAQSLSDLENDAGTETGGG